MASWRSRSQSMAAYRSFSSTGSSSNTSANESLRVSGCRPRAVASLEAGASRRERIRARARSRRRERRPSRRSRPIVRAKPRTAATWPWGWGADDVEGIVEGGDGEAVLEQDAQAFDEVGGPLGEVGEGAFLDLAVLAVGLAEQDGWGRGAVGDRFDVHDYERSCVRRDHTTKDQIMSSVDLDHQSCILRKTWVQLGQKSQPEADQVIAAMRVMGTSGSGSSD